MLSGNSLRQTVHTHCASVHQAAKLVAALLRVAEVTAGLAKSGFMIHVICRLTAKNRDHLRNPTLGNRVWATFLSGGVTLVKIPLFRFLKIKTRGLLFHRLRLSEPNSVC